MIYSLWSLKKLISLPRYESARPFEIKIINELAPGVFTLAPRSLKLIVEQFELLFLTIKLKQNAATRERTGDL